MHISRRFTLVLACLLVLVPLGASTGLIAALSHDEMEEKLQRALESAQAIYRKSAGLSARHSKSGYVIETGADKLLDLGKKKRAVRLRMAALKTLVHDLQNQSDTLIQDHERTSRLFQEEQERFLQFARYLHARRITAFLEGTNAAVNVLRRLVQESVGERVDRSLRDHALASAREDLVFMLLEARDSHELSRDKLLATLGNVGDELSTFQILLGQLQNQYRDTLFAMENAQETVELSEAQLGEVRRETAEVQEQILKMQSELDRIDARVRRSAERDLIDMGLRSPKPGEYSDGKVVGPRRGGGFSWPALGQLSAGFHNAAYALHFHVPHEGVDIVLPQGSQVRAAADGVVFLARDGGQRGFSYILLGHRDGYATLYGHLSAFTVETGDYVSRGQVIGLSGGRPGSHGAGPMTTGSHLHFEVIQRGVHVDPLTVLP
jgi:murein DD-endopeptidase MepM/ murein hydrolase activator NlpD